MSKTILVTDDDKLLRDSIVAMLRGEGYEVTEAEDGQQSLNMALTQHPDLIITDVHMPQMDGLTMVNQLREDEWGKSVSVIVLSNDDTTNAINSALQSGITIYLSKNTLDPSTLQQQVAMVLG